ncbi:MAG: ribosome maturation factor RimP [Firmicutes bacterium]|nr:ribosome maturation factor RimP [Bacillota bacterium]
MTKSDLSAIYNLLEPTVNACNMELYDLEFVTEYGNQILRVYIEKEPAVTLDDCERINNAIIPVLDADDPIPDAYILEVSSPGIERKLVKNAHYQRYTGKLVALKLLKPIVIDNVNTKKLTGTLLGLEDDFVLITQKNDQIKIQRNNIVFCRLVYTERDVL